MKQRLLSTLNCKYHVVYGRTLREIKKRINTIFHSIFSTRIDITRITCESKLLTCSWACHVQINKQKNVKKWQGKCMYSWSDFAMFLLHCTMVDLSSTWSWCYWMLSRSSHGKFKKQLIQCNLNSIDCIRYSTTNDVIHQAIANMDC